MLETLGEFIIRNFGPGEFTGNRREGLLLGSFANALSFFVTVIDGHVDPSAASVSSCLDEDEDDLVMIGGRSICAGDFNSSSEPLIFLAEVLCPFSIMMALASSSA